MGAIDQFFGLAGFVATAELHDFDLYDRPLLRGLARWPGEIVPARSTIPLPRGTVGAEVLVVHDEAHAVPSVIIGVLQAVRAMPARAVHATVDGDKLLLEAEREITLRCGEASITLTRAGKVLIRGHYLLSRSSGHNRIQGAAVDIN